MKCFFYPVFIKSFIKCIIITLISEYGDVDYHNTTITTIDVYYGDEDSSNDDENNINLFIVYV